MPLSKEPKASTFVTVVRNGPRRVTWPMAQSTSGVVDVADVAALLAGALQLDTL